LVTVFKYFVKLNLGEKETWNPSEKDDSVKYIMTDWNNFTVLSLDVREMVKGKYFGWAP